MLTGAACPFDEHISACPAGARDLFIYEEFLTTGGTGEVYSAGHYGDLNF